MLNAALGIAVILLLSGCAAGAGTAPAPTGTTGSGEQNGEAGDESQSGSAIPPLTDVERDFGQAFCQRLESSDPTGAVVTEYDPDYFASWDIRGLPGYGCHPPLGPDGGSITWYSQDPAYCDYTAPHVRSELEAGGYTIQDQSGDLGSTVKLTGSRDDLSYVDWACYVVDEEDVQFFGTIGNEYFEVGKVVANMTLFDGV